MNYKKIIRNLIKKLFGIDGISVFLKKIKKNILKKIYTKKYNAEELINEMCKLGLKEGSNIFIHSSMTEFYNYSGTAEELIEKLIYKIGDEGTLIMPAFPKNKFRILNKEQIIGDVDFDIDNTPSGAGYLTEIFRKYPNVKRSINLQHSVCAIGKYAEYLTEYHHKSTNAFDINSPYYRLRDIDAQIFSLGLPNMLGTIIHCVESILKNKYEYFDLFFNKKVEYTYRDANNNIGKHKLFINDFGVKTNKKEIINKYFDKEAIKLTKISNLTIKSIDAKYLLDTLLNLAEIGITLYTSPSPKAYLEEGKFKLKT